MSKEQKKELTIFDTLSQKESSLMQWNTGYFLLISGIITDRYEGTW